MIVSFVQVLLLGVFVEQMSTQGQDESTMTIDICIMRCRTEYGTTYAGIISGFYCRCGDSHQHEVNELQLSDISCATECPGDPQRNCGGDLSIVIYSVCNRTRYRDITNANGNCDASCHCMGLQACTYSTGLCPAGCEPGWSSAVCNVRNFTSVAGDQSLMTDPVDRSASTGMTVHPTTTLVSATGADQDGRVDPHTNDNIPVIATAVGVSAAFICLVVIAALILHFRKRRHACKSGDSRNEASSVPEVPVGAIHHKDDLAKDKSGIGPICAPSVSSPSLNYSRVVYENHSPVYDNCNDIANSVDDIVITHNHGKVEYEVLRRSTHTEHASVKEKSLYEKLRT